MALVGLGHEGPEDFLLVIAHPRGFRARYPGRSSAARRLVLAASAVSILAVIPPALAPRAAIAQSCPAISGYVYYDVNNNGILEAGEPPIAGSPIELRNAAGALAGSVVTDANGFYKFQYDRSPGIPTQTVTQNATFPVTTTDWTTSKSIPQFDASLGTLKSVTITATGTVTSTIKAESLDIDTATVTATTGGTLTIDAPGGKQLVAVPSSQAGTFDAAPFDGTADYAGPSGHDFGSSDATDSATTTITDAAALAAYQGTGNVLFGAKVIATSRTTGGGNVQNRITTVAGGQLTVVYTYTPSTCLKAGPYAINQTTQPSGYSDGLETSGNTSPIPGTRGTDTISVTIAGGDSTNNNFGELRASLHGCVYVDDNNDGVKDAGEAPIPGVTITLGGAATRTATTGEDGCYRFINLTAGTYTITETQPAAYLDGKDTIGSQGGKTSNDKHYDIVLPAGTNGINNNFGERYAPTPTPTSTPPGGCVNTSTSGLPCATPSVTCTGTGCDNSATPPGGLGSPGGTPGGGTNGRPPGSSITSGGGPGSPGGSVVLSSEPGQNRTGNGTPGVPSAGNGLLEQASSLNVILIGLAIFAASGWLAFLAIGKRREGRGE